MSDGNDLLDKWQRDGIWIKDGMGGVAAPQAHSEKYSVSNLKNMHKTKEKMIIMMALWTNQLPEFWESTNEKKDGGKKIKKDSVTAGMLEAFKCFRFLFECTSRSGAHPLGFLYLLFLDEITRRQILLFVVTVLLGFSLVLCLFKYIFSTPTCLLFPMAADLIFFKVLCQSFSKLRVVFMLLEFLKCLLNSLNSRWRQ